MEILNETQRWARLQRPHPSVHTIAYDVTEQLRTPEEVAAYLDAWLTDAPGDAAGITRALSDIARAEGNATGAMGDSAGETA